jgi:hypothetical protein
MKKSTTEIFIISAILMFIGMKSYAQLYVTNSYVFVKDQYVFVNQDVDLQSGGNVYLRREGQLLQATTGNSANKGVGHLSVFQEGTANNFGYNYWCSPVGLTTPLTGNGQFTLNPIIKRPSDLTTSVLPTYTAGYNGSAGLGALTIATYWIYKFAVSDDYSQWSQIGETGTLDAGLGFTMKGVSGDDENPSVGEATFNNPSSSDNQRYDFRGRPNDGNINIPVLAPTIGTQYPNSTLTGNPYPSAINLNLFLLENSGYTVNYTTGAVTPSTYPAAVTGPINGIAYYWEHQKPATTHLLLGYVGGYGYYVPNNPNAFGPGVYNNATWDTYTIDGSLNTTGGGTGTERYKRMFCPIGQGFMVQGLNGGNAQMKNKYRVFRKENISDSQFERSASTSITTDSNAENWEEIANVAGVDYTQFSKAQVPQIKIHTILNNQYTREVTLAFNPNTTDGFDTAMDAISQEASLINDAYFSITANPNAFVVTTLPFDIDKRVPFTLKAGGTATYKISVGNIINFEGSDNIYLYDGITGVYHDIKNGAFEITLPEGVYDNRFEVTFKDSALGNESNTISSLVISQNNIAQTFTVSNPNALDLKSVKLYDITGKQIFDKQSLGTQNSYQFSTSGLAGAVYLVEVLTNDNRKKAQKIIISNQ